MDNLTSYNVMLNNNYSEFDVWLGDVRRPGPPKCQCNKVLLLPINNLTLSLSSFDSCLCGRCHRACCAFLFGLSYMKCSLSCALSLSNKLLDYFLSFLFVIQCCTNSCVFGRGGGGSGGGGVIDLAIC